MQVSATSIKARREKAGMTQTELARRVGVAYSYICLIESGQRNPSVKLAQKIADVFGCNWWEVYDAK